MRYLPTLMLLAFLPLSGQAQLLPGFKISGEFNEQQMVIENSSAGTRILINAPIKGFEKDDNVLLVFYALPNGNTIEQTFGKKLKPGDDWHYNIQHIGAQTRFLRTLLKKQTIVLVYLEAKQKSWPAWKANTAAYKEQINKVAVEVTSIFAKWNPSVVLNGHSGGGRFIFSYLDALGKIPDNVERVAFIDSDYGYEDSIYGPMLVSWLKEEKERYLCTLAYNDSVVIYNDKPLVSPTGGTWYRSKIMQKYLSAAFRFREHDSDSLLWQYAQKKKILFVFKKNPEGKIFHTQQVELNGFIHSMLSGTRNEQKSYSYFGKRVYYEFISDTIIIPIRRLNIPARQPDAESGSAFMTRIASMALEEREEEIFIAVSSGNIPEFLRNTVTLSGEVADSAGNLHKVVYEAMPDYLSVGSDADFCRIPMNPHTAQRLADLFGASLLTSRLSDDIYMKAQVKLAPFNYVPEGNANELVTKFEEHNHRIEMQRAEAGGVSGQLVAGIKKDVVLSSRIAVQPKKVVIYGWHKPDGDPIQPVYSGHVDWYVDYSHGIRFVNDQVLVDGNPVLLSDILKDPLLFKLFSNEAGPMMQTRY